jgi:hypothetical protein
MQKFISEVMDIYILGKILVKKAQPLLLNFNPNLDESLLRFVETKLDQLQLHYFLIIFRNQTSSNNSNLMEFPRTQICTIQMRYFVGIVGQMRPINQSPTPQFSPNNIQHWRLDVHSRANSQTINLTNTHPSPKSIQ